VRKKSVGRETALGKRQRQPRKRFPWTIVIQALHCLRISERSPGERL
jgi:hypothetical protein